MQLSPSPIQNLDTFLLKDPVVGQITAPLPRPAPPMGPPQQGLHQPANTHPLLKLLDTVLTHTHKNGLVIQQRHLRPKMAVHFAQHLRRMPRGASYHDPSKGLPMLTPLGHGT